MAASSDYWQLNQKTQKDSFKFLFNNQEMSDVTFVIGEDKKTKIPAHTFLLACRSPAFYAMFHGKMTEGSRKKEINSLILCCKSIFASPYAF